MLIDIAQIVPAKTPLGREIVMSADSDKVITYIPPSHKWGGGRESKKVIINRFMLLDDLFFEGLGLWVGEEGKTRVCTLATPNQGFCYGL